MNISQIPIWILIIIVICFLYIGSTILSWHTSTYEDYMYGFWTADNDAFCVKSGIDNMMLFIGEPVQQTFKEKCQGRKTRPCYLVIMNDIANMPFDLTYTTARTGPSVSNYIIEGNIIPNAAYTGESPWPADATFYFDMNNGSLKIKADGHNYAILLKQHDTTNQARAEAAAEQPPGTE
jgi:hypothetical protein